MSKVNTVNEFDKYLNQEIIKLGRLNTENVEAVSYGKDGGYGYKNDVFVSFACNTSEEEHGKKTCICMCRDVLNQKALIDVDITVETAEKIAYYVAGLVGGKSVYRG